MCYSENRQARVSKLNLNIWKSELSLGSLKLQILRPTNIQIKTVMNVSSFTSGKELLMFSLHMHTKINRAWQLDTSELKHWTLPSSQRVPAPPTSWQRQGGPWINQWETSIISTDQWEASIPVFELGHVGVQVEVPLLGLAEQLLEKQDVGVAGVEEFIIIIIIIIITIITSCWAAHSPPRL